MWSFIQDLFMIKDPAVGRDMVERYRFNQKTPKGNVSRLNRRRNRRNKFKANNDTQLKTKVK